MTEPEILNQRLHNQHISRSAFGTPDELVRWMGAVQAQDFLYSLWALGLRLPGLSEVDIEQAIADRTILRTWPMRGTVHFVPAEDAAWMLRLLSPRVANSYRNVHRRAGLDAAIFSKSTKALTEALQGTQMTRNEVYAVLEGAGISANHNTPVGSRGLHIVGQLAQEGLLCFGPRRGRQPTFVLLDEWVANPRMLRRDEALAELIRRYFSSHGPATEYDFAWWSGLTVSDARMGLEMAKSHLETETVRGQAYWFARPTTSAIRKSSRAAHLLPAYDEYTVAYKDRRALLDPKNRSAATARGSYDLLRPVIVIGGRVVGAWKRTIKRDAVEIEIKPITRLSRTQEKAVGAAARRYGRFLGSPVHQEIASE